MSITRCTAGVCLVVAALAAGPGAAAGLLAQGTAPVVPFKIAVPDAVLADLKERLARTRFPSEIEGSGWDYGTNLAYLRELVTYWRTTFDWRAQERRLNQLPQFKTHIEGLDLHFIHKKSSRADAVPLVFVHGWPGSIVEVTKIIGPLTEPPPRRKSRSTWSPFRCPGYGFSDKPKQGGVSNRRIAGMIAQLMARLGYQRYGAQGGDWGGFIVRQLGLAGSAAPDRRAQQHVRGRPAVRARTRTPACHPRS